MIIRSLEKRDIPELIELHAKHFANEFNFPDFFHRYHCAFIVEDEGGIISIGGVRPIAEAVTITNKDRHAKDRAKALYSILDASIFVASTDGYNQLHAFVQDKHWSKRLQRNHFRPTIGQSLVLDI